MIPKRLGQDTNDFFMPSLRIAKRLRYADREIMIKGQVNKNQDVAKPSQPSRDSNIIVII